MSTILAFAVIYLVWGSTFLGIRIAVETLPPVGAAAIRFIISGVILLVIARVDKQRPTFNQWKTATLVAAFFFLGNHTFVGIAAKHLPSSVVALIVATEVPIIALISAGFVRGERLTWRVIIGSILGLTGVASLFIGKAQGEADLPLLPSLGVLFAATSWSVGAVLSQHIDRPADPLLRSGMQMSMGGLLLTISSLLWGERFEPGAFSTRSVSALIFLILIGSVLAFACYTWLLERVPTNAVATHVFVNPLVATILGAWVGGEHIRFAQYVAGGLILTSVMIITIRPRQLRQVQEKEAGAPLGQLRAQKQR